MLIFIMLFWLWMFYFLLLSHPEKKEDKKHALPVAQSGSAVMCPQLLKPGAGSFWVLTRYITFVCSSQKLNFFRGLYFLFLGKVYNSGHVCTSFQNKSLVHVNASHDWIY